MAPKIKVTTVSDGQSRGVQVSISCDPEELDSRRAEVESRLKVLGFTPRYPSPNTAPCAQPGHATLYCQYSEPETPVNADDIKMKMKAALESLRDWAKARGDETELPNLGSA